MSGRIFYLNGRSSEMKCQIFPPLKITPNAVMGLTHFQVYNSIPNVDEQNSSFKYEIDGEWRTIIIPEGTYELSNIDEYLKSILGKDNVSIIANPNTLKCIFWCKYKVNFNESSSIGELFGMEKKIVEAETKCESKEILKISNINSIHIEVDVVTGSYNNGSPTNCIYKCFISTPPGFRILESPSNIVYLPVTTEEIDSITVRLTDEQRNLINFRNEEIAIELHLKLI